MQYNWVNNTMKNCIICMLLMKVIHIRPTVFWLVPDNAIWPKFRSAYLKFLS